MTKRIREFQCIHHPEFQTNSVTDFKEHLHSHQKIREISIKMVEGGLS